MKRTDTHRPAVIVPADYEWVAQEVAPILSLGDCLFIVTQREKIQRHMTRTGGTYASHAHGGNCMVCGNANAIYTHLFYHAASNSYVRMGERCAMKCEMSVDDAAVSAFRRQVEEARKNVAGKAKAAAVLTDAGLAGCWEIYLATPAETDRWEERTIRDIVGKLVKYGSISEKQTGFLGKLLAHITLRTERDAVRAAEVEAAVPAPTGRVKVTGTVLTVKAEEGWAKGYAAPLKMLVKMEAGWKLWCTCPLALLEQDEVTRCAGAERRKVIGSTVTLKVTVTPSEKDPKFAFGKRPTLVDVTFAA